MKTVPSLVASSTIGVAATGLALARPEPATPPRPTSKKRKVGSLVDVNGVFLPPSRPATSSTMTTPDTQLPSLGTSPAAPSPLDGTSRPSNTRFDSFNTSRGRQLSLVRNGDFGSLRNSAGEDSRRDSVSSKGSWIRRLSTMPISQNNSPRSSIGPDSPSLAMSHGSAAPILSNPSDSQAQLPPNKLVKRSTSGKVADGAPSRSGSRSLVPTLRRPATSHQRTITLQQRFRDESIGSRDSSNDRVPESPRERLTSFGPLHRFGSAESRTTWRPFFESRPTKLAKERPSGKPNDVGPHAVYSTSRRVLPNESAKATLVKPSMITLSKTSSLVYFDEDSFLVDDEMDNEADAVGEEYIPAAVSDLEEPQKRPRRSLSLHFSSPGSWVSRSGSLRGKKGGLENKSSDTRYSSAPVPPPSGRRITSANGPTHNHRSITDPTVFQRQPLIETPQPQKDAPNDVMSFHARSRNVSSPLPPLSRLSSFNVDLARLGLSSSSSSQPRQSPGSHAPPSNRASMSISSQGQTSPSLTPYYGSLNAKPNRMSEAVTLVGSEADTRFCASGDEDDVDFRSETVFDSLRSGATGSLRSRNTPLDSMFDESPPSLNGSKNKRLSIHEMMANGTFQEGSKIVEEDEGLSTPVKASHSSQERDGELDTPVRKRVADPDVFPSSSFSLAAKDFGRLSLDDEDDDEDWTRDTSPDLQTLSPPSNQLTARRISPTLRAALADVTHTGSNAPPSAERPKSNVFDWSEPSSAEKLDHHGNSPRPRTAHTKQAADGRGSRAVGRKGPTALHIRSQSVPVVPDVAGQRENSKLAPKFGTWGLGGKGVSEEWDGDFDFEDDGAADEDVNMDSSVMLVPPAIQASQENVVGHVGQIREVCLLVEDLKRLRLLGREKDLLTGASAQLWKEAEGIIALAVPDEEDPTLSPTQSPSSSSEIVDEMFMDHGYAAEAIERPEAPLEVLNRHGRPTGFVYDGNTVRRRSVFLPDDEIFGAGPILNSPPSSEYLRPPPVSPRPTSIKSSSEYARSVMQNMHQTRSTSDPLLGELTHQSLNKMPFDTTSLRDLVHRASVLRSKLSDVIRKADDSYQSADANTKHESSPAFTRVFTDPVAGPPKSPSRSHGNNSMLANSIDTSPKRSLGQQHMHMMTVV